MIETIANHATPAEVQAVVAPATGNKYEIATSGEKSAPVYTTLDTESAAGKKNLYHVTNHPDHTLSEFINKPIRVKDIYIDVNQRMNKDANSDNFGVMEDKPRTILIDENGESYVSGVSIGVFNAVREIIKIFGEPHTWLEPLEIMPVFVPTPKGNMLSLEVL